MRKRIAICLEVKDDECSRYLLVSFAQNHFSPFSKNIKPCVCDRKRRPFCVTVERAQLSPSSIKSMFKRASHE